MTRVYVSIVSRAVLSSKTSEYFSLANVTKKFGENVKLVIIFETINPEPNYIVIFTPGGKFAHSGGKEPDGEGWSNKLAIYYSVENKIWDPVLIQSSITILL